MKKNKAERLELFVARPDGAMDCVEVVIGKGLVYASDPRSVHIALSPADALELACQLVEGARVLLCVRRCRVCRCTDEDGCDGGCSWVEPDLCSACVPPPQARQKKKTRRGQ
jgi:hypothetical protein